MQLGEAPRPQDLCDPQLGRPSLGVDRLLESPSFGSKSDHPSPSVDRIGHAQQVPVLFEVPEQFVDRLLRDPPPIRKLAWTQSLEARIAPEPDVRGVQIVVSRRNDARIQLIADPLPNIPSMAPTYGIGSPLGWSEESLDIVVRLPYHISIVRMPDYPIRDRFLTRRWPK